MGLICLFSFCAKKPRKNLPTKTKTMSNFRKADPTFVNFVPHTCAEAIDLFVRHRNQGLPVHLFPECFVHCSRELPDAELDMFHRWIVCPQGDLQKGGEAPTLIDQQLETERLTILREQQQRQLTIVEEYDHEEEKMSVDEVVNVQEEEKMSVDELVNEMSVDEDYISVVQG